MAGHGERHHGVRVRRGSPKEEKVSYTVADTSIFDEDGGPSKAERMMRAGIRGLRKADKCRLPGWDQMRQRLVGDDAPMLYVFETCTDFIRTVPALQHDEVKPEDVDTNGEDHVGDETRYACMSRPYIRKKPDDPGQWDIRMPTLDEMWEEHDREKRNANW